MLILFILGSLAYFNVLNGPFLFDDEHFIEKNVMIRNLKNIPDIYSSSVTEGAAIKGNFYRPNQQMGYALLYNYFGLDPMPYHLVSILLHILNAFLLFLLILRIGFSRTGAMIAAVFWLLHPIQTEAISYISGLADPLGFFFTLSGMHLFLVYILKRPSIWVLSASVVLFILALATKENQVVFMPLSFLLLFYLIKTGQVKWSARLLIPVDIFIVIAVFYLYFKFRVFNFSDGIGLADQINIYTEHLYIRIYTFISVLWDYVKMIFFPLDLNYEKPYLAYASLWTWRAAFGLFLISSLIASFVYVRRMPELFLALAWFFIGLAPYTGTVPLNAMFLEHWLYIPLAGIAILLASLYGKLKQGVGKTIFLTFFALLMILYGLRTYMRNTEWADIEKFYLNELKYTDSSIRIYNNLGMYYADNQNDEKAIYYYQKSIDAGNWFPQPHHNLSNLYLKQGDTLLALNELQFALEIDPQFAYSLLRLSEVYQSGGQSLKAMDAYELYLNAIEGKKNNLSDIKEMFAD